MKMYELSLRLGGKKESILKGTAKECYHELVKQLKKDGYNLTATYNDLLYALQQQGSAWIYCNLWEYAIERTK